MGLWKVCWIKWSGIGEAVRSCYGIFCTMAATVGEVGASSDSIPRALRNVRLQGYDHHHAGSRRSTAVPNKLRASVNRTLLESGLGGAGKKIT